MIVGLIRQGGFGRRNWTDRWVVLTDFDIEWYENENAWRKGEKPQREALPLHNAEWQDLPDKKYRMAFHVLFPCVQLPVGVQILFRSHGS